MKKKQKNIHFCFAAVCRKNIFKSLETLLINIHCQFYLIMSLPVQKILKPEVS